METTCPICRSEKRISSKFCSISCANRSRKWTDEQKKKISESVKNTVSKKFSNIDVECRKCGKKESVQIFEGSKPPDKFYCSMKCSKSRDHSKETVEKIRSSVQQFFEREGKTARQEKTCKHCGDSFSTEKKSQVYCSRTCSSKGSMSSPEAREQSRIRMLGTLERLREKRRSKNEILFHDLCSERFEDVRNNEAMFDGWDADVLLVNEKIAVLWNGKWHYEKLTKNHSVEQVQKRDEIKIQKITDAGWTLYVIKDMGRHDPAFVQEEFEKFLEFLKK
jgi:hypothetical protein